MATIPLQLAQRRLDAGNVLSYPEGSPVGRAIQGFGDELSAVAERYQQQKQQEEAFDADLARRRFNGQIGQAEDEVAANAPADGAGLHDATYGQVDPRTGRMIKTGLFDTLFADALPKMPESQRANFARQKEALREAGSLRMAARQLQRRDEYEQAEWTKVDNISTSAIAQSNPKDTENFDAIRQNGFDLIAKFRNPLARQAAEVAWRSNTAKALIQAMIAQDPKRAAEMLGAAQAGNRTKDDTTEVVGGSSAFGAPNAAAAKGDRVGKQTPDERVAQAFRDDLPQQEQAALIRQAQAANTAQQVELRTNIGLAEQNAPDAIAQTGAYSGKMPGRGTFRIAYGLDKGDKRFRDFDWRADVGRQVFGMRTMPNQAVHAALRDADSGPNGSQEDQARRQATAAAVGLVMNHRRTDAGGYVSEVFPNIDAAWKAVIGGGLEDPNGYDKDAYDKAIAMSVAAQEYLGIENPQPVPQVILRDLSDNHDSRIAYQQDKNAKLGGLLAGTSGPVARAAVARQLADADLAWIMPVESGYKAPSTLSVLASEGKALGKVVANAGIALANANDWVAYGISGGTISPPDYKDAYYEPSNRGENLMMHQGSDALGWSIPWPTFGRTVVPEKGIARAIESVGSGAAGHAERSIGSLEAAPSSKLAPGQLEKLGAGEGTAPAMPANSQPENFTKLPGTSLDAAGELPIADSNALFGITTPSPVQGGSQTTRSPRKSKLDRELVAAVASELFARDPSRVEHPGAKFGEATTNNYRKAYAQAHPDVNIEDLVIHHQAEQQLLKRLLNFLSKKKINSLENLRGIPEDLNDILHLVIIRSENDNFYAKYPHPTEQQILDHSTMIDKKYGHHFVPHVGIYR